MKDDVRRIHELVGKLSEAIWDKIAANSANEQEILYSESPPNGEPTTASEIEAWRALTDPLNFRAFAQYVEYWNDTEISDYAAKLHKSIDLEMCRRMKDELDHQTADDNDL